MGASQGSIANVAAMAYLEQRIANAQRYVLFPGFVLAMLFGLFGMLGYAGGAFDWGVFEPRAGRNAGMAAACGFFFPFGAVLAPAYAAYVCWKRRILRVFLNEAHGRWNLAVEDARVLVALFR